MKRTTFRQSIWNAQMQRRARANRVYRYPSHPNEHAQHYIVPRVVGGALSDPSASIGALSRVGVSFTRWQLEDTGGITWKGLKRSEIGASQLMEVVRIQWTWLSSRRWRYRVCIAAR